MQFVFKLICIRKLDPMRRKKLPYFIRLVRLAIKCVWHALATLNDPAQQHEVNFWNIPIRKRQRQLR